MTSTTPTTPAATNGRVPSPVPERVRDAGPAALTLPVPFLGTFEMSRAELVYVGGIVGLTALGFLDWPIALVIAGGHVLASDRTNRTVRDLGEALDSAGDDA
jgi:hypothetical protein